MTDVPDCLIDQGIHLFFRDMAGGGCHAVQILNQIPNRCLAIWLACGRLNRIGHHRDVLLVRHFPTEQTLNRASRSIAQLVSPTYGNGLHTDSPY